MLKPYPCLRLAFFIPLILSANNAQTQEQLGMRLERFSGIYSAGINPANTAFTPHNWEVSLFNADLFTENSYAFLRNTSLQNALRNSDKIVSVTDTSAENPLSRDAILQDFADPSRPIHVVLQTRLAGPGFSFRFGDNHTVGLTTAFRTHFSSYQIPEFFAYRNISDLPRNQAINVPSTGLSGMSWAEIGLHYSRLQDLGDVQMAWGVSPKLLLGYEGFSVRAQSNFDYTEKLGDTVVLGSGRWDYAFTTANLTDNSDEVSLKRQGMGMAFDLGVSWAMPSDEEDGSYRWRAGVSLVDAGWVRFRNTARKHRVVFDTAIAVTGADFPGRDNVDDIMQDVSQAFMGDSTASLLGNAFSMALPTALSLQFDAQVLPMLYVGAVLTQRTPFSKNALKRPATLAVVPRFEHRWLSASLPVVVNDWRSVRIGAAARIAWLYLGTDNLNSFFTKDKLSGADFYIGLKINGFRVKSGEKGYRLNRERGNRSSGPNRKKIKCYTF
ncbi:MAG: hypothetical protein IT261_13485 [Saprospiraceae bacterium]|nr:hypothetical protein [Saprospiraceae bacterium]